MHSAKLELLTTTILTTPFCYPVLFQMDVLMPFLILPLVESLWSLTDPNQNFHIIMLKSYHFSKIISICIIGLFEKSLFSLTINNFQMIISRQQLCLNESKEKPKQHCFQFSSVQFTQLCTTLWDPTNWSKPGFPVHHQLPDPTQTHVHHIGDATNHLILCRPLLLLPSIFPSIKVFSNELVLQYQVPNILEFQLPPQSFQWIFRTDFL